MMKASRWMAAFSLWVILIIMGAGSQAQASPPPPLDLLQELGVSAKTRAAPSSASAEQLTDAYEAFPQTGEMRFDDLPTRAPLSAAGQISPQEDVVVCEQLIQNSALDVLELGDGTGRAEPWIILNQKVYYDSSNYVSPDYSLVILDGDSADTETPTGDAFGQGFFMPSQLLTVTVGYKVAMTNTNVTDEVWGSMWSVDNDGYLQDPLAAWEVGQTASQATWYGRYAMITDPSILSDLGGKQLVLVLENQTDGAAPGEWTWFDDVTVTACYTGYTEGGLYLPLVTLNYQTGPSVPKCYPPSENPQDTWDANRGSTETNAVCDSTLSSVDQGDYYSYTPTATDDFTLHLRDLPAGTEWSAMIFVDTDTYPPPFATKTGGGDCRITTPGSGDKSVTCSLSAGTDYFIKVSAGGAYTGPQGDYEMKVEGDAGPVPGAGIHGFVTYQGTAVGGINLALRFYNGSSWSTWGTTATEADGSYAFTGAPSLGSGEKYYVLYDNGDHGNPNNTNYLAVWGSYELTSYTSGTSVDGGDFDIADITLVSPSAGATVALPETFQWNRRAATTSDDYDFHIFDPADMNPWVYAGPLGYVNSFNMTGLPSGFSTNVEYGWTVWANGPSGGYGIAYYYRRVTVSSVAVDSPIEEVAYPVDDLAVGNLIEMHRSQ